jgi:hypothetical protein
MSPDQKILPTQETTLSTQLTESEQQWRRVREYLNAHRYVLTQQSVHAYPERMRVAGTPLLARPSWIAGSPVPLDQVPIEWSAQPWPTAITGADASLDHIRPQRWDGTPYRLYSSAVEALARPTLFENRNCYRLLDVAVEDGLPGLTFGRGQYFDVIDICEAAAHEFAAGQLGDASVSRSSTPFRAALEDPTDLRQRPVMAAISTLTIRHDPESGDAEFLLHWRDPQKVATNGGLYQVMPVGMFQPSHDAPWNESADFDLWRSMVRELSEELLGTTEDYGSNNAAIDYAKWPFHAALERARSDGDLRVYWLGLGIDPLTYVCDMLTVVVVNSATFDVLFPKLASTNSEGRLVGLENGTGRSIGIPFRADHVERLTQREQMQPAGAALLRLAWNHRAVLMGQRSTVSGGN